jgi:hypothetical protein
VGGVIKWVFGVVLKRRGASEPERARAENVGILLSSGFIAGESLMAVLLALLVMGNDFIPGLLGFQRLTGGAEPSTWLGLIIYPVALWLLVWFAASKMRDQSLAAAKAGE